MLYSGQFCLIEVIMLIREHHFYVAVAKHVFIHQEDGIVFVSNPIRIEDARIFGLKPLIMYGLTVPGTQIKWSTFSTLDEPRSLMGVLQEAWESVKGLRGYPDILKINRYLAESSPEITSKLDKYGITAVVSGDRHLSASLRVAQQSVFDLTWNIRCNTIKCLEDLNTHAMYCHDEEIKTQWLLNKNILESAKLWLDIPHRPINMSRTYLMDWSPGKWLYTWEANVPHNSARVFKNVDRVVILCNITDRETTEEEIYDYCAAKKSKIIVDCWPNSQAEIAKAIGSSVKELQWFLANKGKIQETEGLFYLLGIEINREYVDYDIVGPCVLLAKNMKAIKEVYDELSHGGDLEFSIEVVPQNGMPDPSWRYLVFCACAGFISIIMIPRGGDVSEHVETFINFQGIKSIPMEKYQKVVSTCAKACLSIFLNRRSMIEFNRSQMEFYEQFSQW